MNYPYSADNGFDKPQTYMYAPFAGQEFLAAYVADRRNRLGAYVSLSHDFPCGPVLDRLISMARNLAGDSASLPDAFSPEQQTELKPLLAALLRALAAGDTAHTKDWLARLVQRFEVSKRLYAVYEPGFRKGSGESRTAGRYGELALCLALAHIRCGHLQYLSTMLKLVDLLLSLDADTLRSSCSPALLELLVEAELDAVSTLAVEQGLRIDEH